MERFVDDVRARSGRAARHRDGDRGIAVDDGEPLRRRLRQPNPAWAVQTTGSVSSTSVYVGDLGGGLGATLTSDGTTVTSTLDIADPAGSVVTTVTLPASGNATGIDGYAVYDEYGTLETGTPADTGALDYGWLGSQERAVGGASLILMGARLYNACTGRFTSADPVRHGNENLYNYPNPVNSADITGRVDFWTWLLIEAASWAVGWALKAVACAAMQYMCPVWALVISGFVGAAKEGLTAYLDHKSRWGVINAIVHGFIMGVALNRVLAVAKSIGLRFLSYYGIKRTIQTIATFLVTAIATGAVQVKKKR